MNLEQFLDFLYIVFIVIFSKEKMNAKIILTELISFEFIILFKFKYIWRKIVL